MRQNSMPTADDAMPRTQRAVSVRSIVPRPLPVTSTDRLGLTLFCAGMLHAILILGVSLGQFDLEPRQNISPPIEITLVTKRSEQAPAEPEFLAQANQQGGTPLPAPVPATNPPPPALEFSPAPAVEPAAPQPPVETLAPEPLPEPAPEPPQEIAEPPPAPAPPPAKKSAQPKKKVLTQDKAPQQLAPEPETAAAPPSAAQLINRSMEIASLSAQVSESMQAYAQRPRQKFLSAQTREYKYAAYMEAWRAKVERIGNLNYPDEAKRQKLSGSLVLDVALNPDGTINNITLRRASGHKVLDDAALRIVKLAAPYAPFPADIRKDTDILHIIRTWQFTTGNRLSSR